MRPSRLLRLTAFIALAACAPSAPSSRAVQPGPLARAAAGIGAEGVRAHLDTLAGDALGGRETPSPGLDAAAVYIESWFRAAGLRPAGAGGGYVHRYLARTVSVRPARRRFEADWRNGHASWRHGGDYFMFPSVTGAAGAPAVFAGTITPATTTLAVRPGQVAVVFLPGDPMENVGAVSAVIPAAMEARAAGVAMVTDPGVDADSLAWFAGQMYDAQVLLPLPVAGLRWEAAREMLRAGGVDPDSLRAGVAPRPLDGVRITMDAPVDSVRTPVPNVVAMLPGSDPRLRDEYVVVTAHFDHVGAGTPGPDGDTIYNGADDNASGVAAMLEAARALAALPTAPARSIVFLAVSGEEMGLQGAMQWAQNPTVPLDRVVANLNLDMVGRNAPDTLYVLGQDYSSLGDAVRRVAAAHPELGFSYPSQADPKLRWFSRSDHVAFVYAGVPVLFLSTLPHRDYHRASDEPETIDVEKLTRVSRFLFLLAHAVASDTARPAWTATGLDEARRAVQ